MNKFIKVFMVMLMVLGIAGCNSVKDEEDNNVTVSKRYEIDDVFSNYDSKEPVLMLTGDSIKLSDYIKETELSYSYVLKGSEDTDNQQSESPTNGKYKDPTLTKEEVMERPLEEDLKDFNNRFYIYEKYGYTPDMCGDMTDSEWIGELLTLNGATMPLLDSYCNWAIFGVDILE